MAELAAVQEKYRRITKALIEGNISVTTMESCTSGLLASLLTDTEGASAILKGAFVTYSNEGKILQGVPEETIETYGVYSEETARAMSSACRNAYNAEIGIGITGSFGNADTANPDSVPGSVDFALDVRGEVTAFHLNMKAHESRFAYKVTAADAVADELMKVLSVR